jgi:hypothetical protein
MSTQYADSETLNQLRYEGTEFIQPERAPTFDELVEQLKTRCTTQSYHTGYGPQVIFTITDNNYYQWLIKLKEYALTSKHIDNRLFDIVSDPHNNGYNGCGMSQLMWVCEKTRQQSSGEFRDKISTLLTTDFVNITSFKSYTLGRLNKTINDTALNTSDIITQGRELTDHRAQLDLITEAVDSTTQDCIKNEQRNQFQFSELRGRIQILETTTPVEFKNIKTQLTKQQQILDDVVSVHLDNYEQNENMVSSKLHKLQNSYSQLEDHVSKMTTTQQTEIKIMETGITNIRERLARMDEREEKLNSDIKEMKNSIIVLLFAVILILSCLISKLYM